MTRRKRLGLQRVLRVLLAVALILSGLAWWQPRFVLRWVAAFNPDVLFFVETKQPLVALTIDDAPYPTLTPRILDVLATHHAHATFFVIGDHIPSNEPLLERMVADGHELANHQLHDKPSIRLSAAEFAQQLALTHERLIPFGPIRYFRPASGWFNRRMLQQLEPYGYRCVLGSAYPEDLLSSPTYLSRHILFNVAPGSIIILHDGSQQRTRTVAVLERVLPELQRRGYRVVTVSELLASSQHEHQ